MTDTFPQGFKPHMLSNYSQGAADSVACHQQNQRVGQKTNSIFFPFFSFRYSEGKQLFFPSSEEVHDKKEEMS